MICPNVKKSAKLGGFVNSTADFTGQPEIVNGASNLMVDVFGEEVGMHARAAVGMSSLPLGASMPKSPTFNHISSTIIEYPYVMYQKNQQSYVSSLNNAIF